MPHPLITINSTVQSSGTVTTSKNNAIYIVGTKGTGGTIAANEIKLIRTLDEFNTVVGSSSLSAPAFRFLRSIDDAVKVYFVNGLGGGTPTLADNLIAGLLAIGKNLRLPPGIIVMPELGTVTPASAIVPVFQAAQNLVSNLLLNWEYYHNSSLAANNKATAIAERTSLTSTQGHSSFFFGYGRDANNNQIPLSVVAAAKSTYLNRNRPGYFSPSAYQEALPFTSVDAVFLPKWEIGTNEYTDLLEQQINTIYADGDGFTTSKFSIFGSRTLSTDSAWKHINTRYAANNLFNRASDVLEPFLFLPADVATNNLNTANIPTGIQDQNVNADLIMAVQDLLSQMDLEGAFSVPSDPTDDKFSVRPIRQSDGSIALIVSGYLVQTREKVTFNFVKKG